MQYIFAVTSGSPSRMGGGSLNEIIFHLSPPLSRHGYMHKSGCNDPPPPLLDERGQGGPYAGYGYGTQMFELEVVRGWGEGMFDLFQ